MIYKKSVENIVFLIRIKNTILFYSAFSVSMPPFIPEEEL